jgi:hypothetical protein
MNPHSGIDVNNNNRRTKAIAAAIPMAGIVIAAALLSGLSLINSYQPAIAQQQNMTGAAGGNATTGAAGGNQSEVRFHIEEARTAIEDDDDEAALMHLDLALNALGGNMTATAGASATNATTALGGPTAEEGETAEEEAGEDEGEEGGG